MSRRRAGPAWHLPTERSSRPTASVYPATAGVKRWVVYRRQRPIPLLSRTAKSRNQSQLGVDGFDVAHERKHVRFPPCQTPASAGRRSTSHYERTVAGTGRSPSATLKSYDEKAATG